MRRIIALIAVTVLSGTFDARTTMKLAQSWGPGPYYEPQDRGPNPEYFRGYRGRRDGYITPEQQHENERRERDMRRYRRELSPNYGPMYPYE
jgi:hypothetical protein